MKRHAVGLSIFLLALLSVACNRDTVTGVPSISGQNVAGPKKLQDAIAFFTRQFNSVDGGLGVMRVDGSGRRPLPGGELGFEPSISPDGRRIAFSRNTDIGVTSVYVMNVDGTGTTSVAQGIVLNPGPVWSPDGCQIAFRSSLETNGGPVGRISIVNADGTGLHQVSPEPGPNDFAFDESPTWSPTGTQLAFTRNSVLHVINVDGTGLTALPNEDMALNPSWSPDGQRIAYMSGDPFGEIRLRNPDGSNLAQVTVATPGTFDFWPRWAPDSRRLVIAHVAGDQIQTVTINADGTNPVNLTPAGVLDFMPDWSRRSEDEDFAGGGKCRQ
jgi:TolB protein